MSDLVEFLRARLTEDEASAKEAAAVRGDWIGEIPARLLREVEAKRKILAESERYDMDDLGYQNALDFAVAELAAVYSDHPDYQKDWE